MANQEVTGELPEVIKKVTGDIKTLGDNVKDHKEKTEKTLTDLRSENDKFKEGLLSKDAMDEKLDKFSTDIITRMKAVEEVNTRMDAVETALKRSGTDKSEKKNEPSFDDALNFTLLTMAVRGALRDDDIPSDRVDFETYKLYQQKSFKRYLRKGDEPGKNILTPKQMKALIVGEDPEGGYLCPPTIAARIIELIYESTPVRQLAAVDSISTTSMEMKVDVGEAGGGWLGEEQTPAETTTPKLGQKTITTHTAYARPKASSQLLDDAAVNAESWLVKKVSQKLSRLENTAFMQGSGVGQPRGLLTYTAGTPSNTNWGTVIRQIITLSDGSATYPGLVNIITGLKAYYHPRASWLTSPAFLAQLMTVQDPSNSYMFAQQMNTGKGFPSTFMGYPLLLGSDFPTLATDSLACVFGDFSEGYQIVDRLGITVLRDPYTSKPFVEFYTRKRVGGDVANYEAMIIGKASTS